MGIVTLGILSCSDAGDSPVNSPMDNGNSSSVSKNGSMARFTQVGNFLYTLNNGMLTVINVETPASPSIFNEIPINWDSETLFPMDSALFIGGQNGMQIYSLEEPSMPIFESNYTHFRSCDPVVVEGTTAYVTLRGGSRCGGKTNQLEILDVANFNYPRQITTYPMYNPHGLAVSNSVLYICDGEAGLKCYDVTNPLRMKLLQHIGDIDAYDIILRGTTLMAITSQGLVQYDRSSFPMKFLSIIPIAE